MGKDIKDLSKINLGKGDAQNAWRNSPEQGRCLHPVSYCRLVHTPAKNPLFYLAPSLGLNRAECNSPPSPEGVLFHPLKARVETNPRTFTGESTVMGRSLK